MKHNNWVCPKCRHDEFEIGNFSATGKAAHTLFNIQNNQFTTVTCLRCRYTELYKIEPGKIVQMLDKQ